MYGRVTVRPALQLVLEWVLWSVRVLWTGASVRRGPFGPGIPQLVLHWGTSVTVLLFWWSNTRFNKHNFGKFREKKWFQISGENVILTVSRNKQGVVESNKQIRSIIDLPLRVILIWNARGLHGGFMTTTCTSPNYNKSKTSENPGFWLDENSFRWFYYKRAREWIILLIQKNSRRPLKHFFGE